MKHLLIKIFNTFIPISKQYLVRYRIRRVKELLNWLCLWKWQFFVQSVSRQLFEGRIYYLGRKSNRENIASMMLGFRQAKLTSKNNKVIVTELPIPTFLRIPHYLTTIIPLYKRSPAETLQLMSKRKRKFLRNRRARYHIRAVSDDVEIKRVNYQQIRPYATARYGQGVAHLSDEEVMNMAKINGKLNLVYLNDQEIACHIGCVCKRENSKFWHGERAGYPKFVQNNNRLYRETNLMNTYIEIEWAHQNGFDYYDLGYTVAQPDNGVLQWKRSFRGQLDPFGNLSYFYLKPPNKDRSVFFWEVPVFSLENKTITLHLGLPDKKTLADLMSRLKTLNFGGISKVYLYTKQLQVEIDNLGPDIAKLFRHCDSAPEFKVVTKHA